MDPMNNCGIVVVIAFISSPQNSSLCDLAVPGPTCGAPNVSMIASGRTCSRKTTEANFPDTIENSYSQQEETKPNIGASRNRLLLSQVAYFLNYQLKTYRDQKDHNEEQKCRESKNKLLMSQVAYYLGCRLKMEVPGYLCSAPNVSTVTSGKPPSRKNTEVNIPEDIEKSCSQQEENKANFRASKNRLLLSQVAYFLNYQLKTYKDRKDHEEEQKCRDSKNKLLMSQVAYYLGCRLKTEVPGYLCSAPNVSMVASERPPSRKNTEVNIVEDIEMSCFEQEENKPTFRASKNRLLMSQVAYFLNYWLKTYKDQKDHDEEQKCRDSKNKLLMSQVAYYLGCRLKTEVPGFLCSARNISKVASGRSPSRKNTELNILEGIDKFWSQQEDNKSSIGGSKNRLLMSQVDYSLNYRLKTCKDRQDHEIQKYRESKNNLLMRQAAYYLRCQLKTKDRRRHEEEQKYRDSKNKLLMSQDYPGCRLKTEKSQSDDEEEEEKGPVSTRNLQESVEEEAPQESWDEDYSTLSIPPGTFAFNEPYRTNLHSLEEQQVNLAHDIDKIEKDQEEEEDQGPLCPRLSMELVEAEEPEVFWYSLDILYSTYTAYLEFYYTCQAYTYAVFLYAEEHVRLTLDMDSRFFTLTVVGLHLVSRIGVIFPH
ncbi:NBPF family member NBPF11-like isoform X2 [Callithrix jacchus]